jgi:CubicO group peptidase (beta-lactamase class C family)
MCYHWHFWWIDAYGGYSAHGYGRQYIFIVPDLKMVAVFTSGLNNPDTPQTDGRIHLTGDQSDSRSFSVAGCYRTTSLHPANSRPESPASTVARYCPANIRQNLPNDRKTKFLF